MIDVKESNTEYSYWDEKQKKFMVKVVLSQEEKEYIIKELYNRIFEIHSFVNNVETYLERCGGIESILNSNRSEDTYQIILRTDLVAGDFMQILQRYRRENEKSKENQTIA